MLLQEGLTHFQAYGFGGARKENVVEEVEALIWEGHYNQLQLILLEYLIIDRRTRPCIAFYNQSLSSMPELATFYWHILFDYKTEEYTFKTEEY